MDGYARGLLTYESPSVRCEKYDTNRPYPWLNPRPMLRISLRYADRRILRLAFEIPTRVEETGSLRCGDPNRTID